LGVGKLRPTFVISLDEELVWGSFDHTPAERFHAANPDLRGTVRRLLALFDRHSVPVTWAVVGHLFLSSCERGENGRAHPDVVRPRFSWYAGDWLADDPCSNRAQAPLWYGDDLIEMIQAAATTHEIGSHSFSHVVYGDPGCSRAAAVSDVRACLDAAQRWGVRLRSFVFPRNVGGHHQVLAEHGFVAYRGEEPTWYRTLPGRARRMAHLAEQAACVRPPVSVPQETLPGLWNIPGSMILLPRHGVRRMIPLGVRLRRGTLGLTRAVEERQLFHLWFHPFNFSRDREAMLQLLDQILRHATRLRDGGELDIVTMGGLADKLRAQCPDRSSRGEQRLEAHRK
jgi:peptidoglycan/xylan/chitin deacetylase (PgdA/CDA1 family)